MMITGAMKSERGGHGQVPLHLPHRCGTAQSPSESDPVARVLARVQQRQEEVVEGVENREQRHGRDGRLGEPHEDGEQDPDLAAAVDPGRVEVLLAGWS